MVTPLYYQQQHDNRGSYLYIANRVFTLLSYLPFTNAFHEILMQFLRRRNFAILRLFAFVVNINPCKMHDKTLFRVLG